MGENLLGQRETEGRSQSQGLWSLGSFLACLLPVILNWHPSWEHTNQSAEMDSSEKDPRKSVGPLDWRLPSLFDLSRILVAGSLWVP